MRGGRSGVIGYPKRRALGAAALAGAASLGGSVHAAEAVAVAEVSGVDVIGARRALDGDTGLAVLPTSVQDTPQAISVISGAQLKAQGTASLEQALRNVPGITIAIGEGGTLNGDQFKIRGFDAKDDVYVDGLRDFGVYTRDSFNYEEVQVLKGPSGALFGRGTTGGVINTVSKRPKLQDSVQLDGYAGTGDYYRALADVNHRLGETSALRLNLMASSTGVVDRDRIKSDRWGAALSLAYGIGTDTTITATYLHQADRRVPDHGVIIVQPPGQITAMPATEYGVGVERSSFLGFETDRDRTKADILTVRLSHEARPGLTFNSDTRLGAYSRYFQYTTTDQCNAACTAALFDGDPATEAFGGIGGSGPYDQDSWGLQNISTVRADFRAGGLKAQGLLGLDLSHQANDRQMFAYTLPAPYATRPSLPHPLVEPNPRPPAGYTVFRPVPGANLFCSGSGNCTTNVLGGSVFSNTTPTAALKTEAWSTDLAAFGMGRVWFTDALSVIGTLRVGRYEAKVDTLQMNGAQSPPGGLKVKATLTSPRASLVYEPSPTQTYYLSWGRSQTPQGTSVVGAGTAVALTARDLEPEESEIWEAGAKVALFGGPLSLTASVFQVKKDNALQTDAGTGFLMAQSGEQQKVRGVELGLAGKVTPAWTVSAGYAWLDAEIEQSFSNCSVAAANATGTPTGVICPLGAAAAFPVLNTAAVGQQVTSVPEHSASLFTTYDLGERVRGLTIGGDLTWQSEMFLSYQARSLSYADRATLVASRIAKAPEGFTVNAFATWRFDRYALGLNVYNLTDELAYTQVFSNRAIPTAGRTVVLSFGARF